jgi:predicted permease
LIACANLASLMLARSMARRAEMGIRLAIGAGRARLVRQLLTESLVLSLLGGCLGLVFAFWIGRLLFGFFPPAFARVALNIRPDFRVLLFTSFLSMLTGVFFGLVPALQATKTDPLAVMKGGSPATRRGFNLGNLLVISEVGLSLVLLMIAGLLVRTLQNLKNVHSGFSAENVVLFSLRPTQNGYTGTRLRQFYMELLRRSTALPGVRAAAMAEGGPLSGREGGSLVAVSNGRPDAEGGDVALNDVVSPRFFETLGIQVLAGRDFTVEDDLARPKVAIVDENFVHRFLGDLNPIGRKVLVPDEPEWNAEIIGVVNASKHRSLREPPLPMVYFSILQEAKPFHPSLYVQADGKTAPLIAAVRREVQAVDKDVAVFNVKPLQQQVNESILRERLVAALSGSFGLLAALLVAVGLYGIITYSVVRRTREIGIRMAVGADRGDVIRLVMKETLTLATLGIVPGVLAAFAVTRLIANQLYAVTPTDTVTMAGAIMFLVAVAAIAGYLPARQAARVDPTVALRYE